MFIFVLIIAILGVALLVKGIQKKRLSQDSALTFIGTAGLCLGVALYFLPNSLN